MMDSARFDGLAWALGRAASRRAAMAALLASAAVRVVPAAADSACDVCPSGCRFASLQAAIAAAKAGDTIRICAGTYVSQRPVSVTKALTLAGAGANQTTLTSGGKGRVLDIASLKPGMVVTLQDLTVSGGAEPNPNRGGGGGILVDKASLVLQNCRVQNNTALPHGGGIRLQPNSALTLRASEVRDNAAAFGGGISVGPGATVTLQADSRVADNRSTHVGGGIDAAGTVIIEAGGSVTGNTAGDEGGGIYVGRGAVTLAAGSQVSGNTAGKAGGGLFTVSHNATATIADASIVTDNAPDNCGGKAVDNCID